MARRSKAPDKKIAELRKEQAVVCYYCKHFYASEPVSYQLGKGRTCYRLCKMKGFREVRGVDKACEHFVVSKWFYCDRLNCWQEYLACVSSRRKLKLEECSKCPQFNDHIFFILRILKKQKTELECTTIVEPRKPLRRSRENEKTGEENVGTKRVLKKSKRKKDKESGKAPAVSEDSGRKLLSSNRKRKRRKLSR